jgi:cytochrome c2
MIVVVLGMAGACARDDRHTEARILTGGDPVVGRALIKDFGCGSCHAIPGVRGATGLVGPPLKGIASRAYIAGVLPNTPENMQRWILDPQAVDSLTVMPKVGLNPTQARHVATYLYTLR